MKLSLSENISKLRKANDMTQERLAEALGVSFAAVSKWERGVATPELSLIADMADLFRVSIDALIGYEFCNNDKDTVVQRLKQYVHDREAKDALSDAEKALQRYPNCFEIVYYSAVNYRVRGIYQQEPAYSKRALTLYRHACRLIGQNTDPEISELSIGRAMADIHLTLGEYDEGLEILKKNNPCRLNHSLIGETLASSCNDPEGALPYLSIALIDLTVSHMQIVIGYANLYEKTKDYKNAIALLDWALSFFPGLKKPGQPSALNKSEALLWAVRAEIHLRLNEPELAADCLRRAKAIALEFDAAPSYDVRAIRFVSQEESASSVDDLGDTAMDGIEKTIAESDSGELLNLWRMIKDEK